MNVEKTVSLATFPETHIVSTLYHKVSNEVFEEVDRQVTEIFEWKGDFEGLLKQKLAEAVETIRLEQDHREIMPHLNPEASEKSEEFFKGQKWILERLLGEEQK